MDRNYEVVIFSSKFLFLRGALVVIFAYIIKIVTMFTKTIFQDSRKLKKYEKLCIKMQSISLFLDIAKLADF